MASGTTSVVSIGWGGGTGTTLLVSRWDTGTISLLSGWVSVTTWMVSGWGTGTTWVVSRRGNGTTSVLFEWGNGNYLKGVWKGCWNFLMVSGWGTGTTWVVFGRGCWNYLMVSGWGTGTTWVVFGRGCWNYLKVSGWGTGTTWVVSGRGAGATSRFLDGVLGLPEWCLDGVLELEVPGLPVVSDCHDVHAGVVKLWNTGHIVLSSYYIIIPAPVKFTTYIINSSRVLFSTLHK